MATCQNIIKEKDWKPLWTSHPFKSPVFAVQLQTLKAMMRWYYPLSKLHLMNPTYSYLCVKQCIQIVDFMHNWWHCEPIKNFWNHIILKLKKITGKKIPLLPE